MKYVYRSNTVRVHKVSGAEDEYLVDDFYHKKLSSVSKADLDMAARLDGKTDPILALHDKKPSEVRRIVEDLTEKRLLRRGRILSKGLRTMITLKRVYDHESYIGLCKVLNALLMVSFIPVLMLGILLKCDTSVFKEDPVWLRNHYIPIFIGILVVNLFFNFFMHEMCHAIACKSYGGRVYEFGYIFPLPCFYVLMDPEREILKSRLYRVQVYMAGMEGNAIIGGLWLIASKTTGAPLLSDIFTYCATFSLSFIVINSLFCKGLDGRKAINVLLGIPAETSIFYLIKRSFVTLFKKNSAQRAGINAFITIIAMLILLSLSVGVSTMLIVEEVITLSMLFTNKISFF